MVIFKKKLKILKNKILLHCKYKVFNFKKITLFFSKLKTLIKRQKTVSTNLIYITHSKMRFFIIFFIFIFFIFFCIFLKFILKIFFCIFFHFFPIFCNIFLKKLQFFTFFLYFFAFFTDFFSIFLNSYFSLLIYVFTFKNL